MLTKLFCVFSLLCSGLILHAQNLRFRHFGVPEGLEAGWVDNIAKDSLGYLWAGTDEGLYRFDGARFKPYFNDPRDSTSLLTNNIKKLHVEPDGTLWVSYVLGGLSRYLPESDNFHHYTKIYADTGTALITTSYYFHTTDEGDFLVRDVDLRTIILNRKKDCFEPYTELFNQFPEMNEPVPFHHDEDGNVWVFGGVRNQRRIGLYNAETGQAQYSKSTVNWINCAKEQPEGVFWIGTWGHGLIRYDLVLDSIFFCKIDPNRKSSLPGRVVFDTECDKDGNLWVATDLGLGILSADQMDACRPYYHFQRPIDMATGRPFKWNTSRIIRDESDRMWLSTLGNGVFLYDHNALQYEVLRPDIEKKNIDVTVDSNGFVEDENGCIWYAEGNTLIRWDPKTKNRSEIVYRPDNPEGIYPENINSISLAFDGRINIYHSGGNVSLLDPSTLKVSKYLVDDTLGRPSHQIEGYRDKQGHYWLSTYYGVLRYYGNELTAYDTIIPRRDSRQVVEDAYGNMWIGSWNDGMARVNIETFEYVNYDPKYSQALGLQGDDTHQINIDASGNLWVLTSVALNKYIVEENRFEAVSLPSSVPFHKLRSFSVDHEGFFWFTSVSGLYRWHPETAQALLINEEYGLPKAEYYETFVDSKGTLYSHSTAGVLVLDPSQIKDPPLPSAVHLDQIYLEQEDTSRTIKLGNLSELALSHKDNYVRIDFSPLKYNQTGHLTYAYQLEGSSESWVNIGRECEIVFLDIPVGDYQLNIKAINELEQAGPSTSIQLLVEPPWWRSKYAYAGYFLFIALCTIGYNRLRLRQLKRNQKVLEHKVKVRTKEIRKEKERSESLLLNILPVEIAEELKAKGTAEARQFDEATILFSDFAGFTKMASTLNPHLIVSEIDYCFKAFDHITSKYGLEKIKTIGDAYMAAGGLPDPNHGSPAQVIEAALVMQEFVEARIKEQKANEMPYFEMRIGVHTGPVIAGIVGVKKFQYDIWGDTVNIASRMESKGEIGKVNVSHATYLKLKDNPKFGFSQRGFIEVKGKGEMRMYFVHQEKK